MRRRSHLGPLGLVAAVAVLAVSLAVVLGEASDQRFPDLVPQVRDMFTSALVAWDTDGYGAPGTVENSVPPATPAAAELAQQREAGYADAERYFAPGLAAELKDRVDRSVAAQRDPNVRFLGTGIRNLVIESLTLDDSGTIATVVATFTHWANSAQRNPDDGAWSVFTPSNDVRATARMERQASGEWVMADYRGEFINGTEP